MTEWISCNRCRMTFRCEPLKGKGEHTICAEAGCDQRFWHQACGKLDDYIARVGIDPKDASKLREEEPWRSPKANS